MKITDRDKQLFKALSASQIGKDLGDYLERLSDDICDSRTWGTNDTKESSNVAAARIKDLKIKIAGKQQSVSRTDEHI